MTVERLRKLGDSVAAMDSGSGDAKLIRWAADEIERLHAALTECAADFSTNPGTVLSAAAEINSEFQRRMEIAGVALNFKRSAT